MDNLTEDQAQWAATVLDVASSGMTGINLSVNEQQAVILHMLSRIVGIQGSLELMDSLTFKGFVVALNRSNIRLSDKLVVSAVLQQQLDEDELEDPVTEQEVELMRKTWLPRYAEIPPVAAVLKAMDVVFSIFSNSYPKEAVDIAKFKKHFMLSRLTAALTASVEILDDDDDGAQVPDDDDPLQQQQLLLQLPVPTANRESASRRERQEAAEFVRNVRQRVVGPPPKLRREREEGEFVRNVRQRVVPPPGSVPDVATEAAAEDAALSARLAIIPTATDLADYTQGIGVQDMSEDEFDDFGLDPPPVFDEPPLTTADIASGISLPVDDTGLEEPIVLVAMPAAAAAAAAAAPAQDPPVGSTTSARTGFTVPPRTGSDLPRRSLAEQITRLPPKGNNRYRNSDAFRAKLVDTKDEPGCFAKSEATTYDPRLGIIRAKYRPGPKPGSRTAAAALSRRRIFILNRFRRGEAVPRHEALAAGMKPATVDRLIRLGVNAFPSRGRVPRRKARSDRQVAKEATSIARAAASFVASAQVRSGGQIQGNSLSLASAVTRAPASQTGREALRTVVQHKARIAARKAAVRIRRAHQLAVLATGGGRDIARSSGARRPRRTGPGSRASSVLTEMNRMNNQRQ